MATILQYSVGGELADVSIMTEIKCVKLINVKFQNILRKRLIVKTKQTKNEHINASEQITYFKMLYIREITIKNNYQKHVFIFLNYNTFLYNLFLLFYRIDLDKQTMYHLEIKPILS